MRLWTLHPSMLDTKGLVALWRETIQAQRILLGWTTGYAHHPQVVKFKEHEFKYFSFYITHVYLEGKKRGFNFDPGYIYEYNDEL